MQARRDRNRQAQNDFRQRRQIAERAQEARIQYLEDVVEQMSGIIVNIYDHVSGLEQVVGQPGVVSQLQQSISQALRLATTALGPPSAETGTAATPGQQSTSTLVVRSSPGRRVAQQPPGVHVAKTAASSSTMTPSHSQSSLDLASGGNRTLAPQSQASMAAAVAGRNVSLDFVAPFIQNLSPFGDWLPLDANAKPLALRLAETSLLWAWSILSGQIPTTSDQYERIFSSTLRSRPRAVVMNRLQYVLGEGRGNMLKPAGMDWEVTPEGESAPIQGYAWNQQSSSSSSSSSSSDAGPGHRAANSSGLITAIEVSSQLEKLGAHFVGADIMELSFKADENPQLASLFQYHGGPNINIPAGSRVVHARLDSAFLSRSLALAGTCLDFGPAFPLAEIGKAIQASTIVAWGE
jgi:hypothetical protein